MAKGTQYRVATTDTPQSLISKDAAGNPCNYLTMVCETNNVRVAINAVPTQGASGVGTLLYPGDVIEIDGVADVAGMQFISAANGVAGALQVIPEY